MYYTKHIHSSYHVFIYSTKALITINNDPLTLLPVHDLEVDPIIPVVNLAVTDSYTVNASLWTG